jgi:hypothetical protein
MVLEPPNAFQLLMMHTVREILPELVTQLMSLLSAEETEQQEVQ